MIYKLYTLENKFELPLFCPFPIEEVFEKLNNFTNVVAKRHYLDRVISNYKIDEAGKKWDEDCEECLRQGYDNRPHWLGIFSAFFGELSNPFDEDKEPGKFELYNYGVQAYQDYLRLCELRDNLNAGIKVNLSDNNNTYTHREVIIAHEYKRKAKIEDPKTGNDWKKERGNGCYLAYYTLQKGTENKANPYKEPTLKELNNVLELLKDFPQLQKQVQHDIKSL